MSFNNIAIVYIERSAYRIHFWYISKDHVITITNGSNLVDKSAVLYIYIYIFFVIYKNELTYYQRNREVVLNKAKDYYKNNKERLRGQARDKYKNFSQEEKNKKRE